MLRPWPSGPRPTQQTRVRAGTFQGARCSAVNCDRATFRKPGRCWAERDKDREGEGEGGGVSLFVVEGTEPPSRPVPVPATVRKLFPPLNDHEYYPEAWPIPARSNSMGRWALPSLERGRLLTLH